MAPTRRDIEFTAYEGDVLRGWWYPAQSNAPVIVMSHGLGGLKEHFLDDFAARFQAAGFAVLLYDNRNWGASGGHPKNESNPWRQIEDIHDAVGFVKTLAPEIDPTRIAIWGSSYSGGNVLIAAAVDHRVKAVVSQVPFVSGESVEFHFPEKLKDLMYANRTHDVPSHYVPLFVDDLEVARSDAPGKPILGTEESYHYLQKANERNETHDTKWENKISIQTFYHMLKHEPINFIHRIAPRPLLMVVALKDTVLDHKVNLAAFERAGEGKELFTLDGGHFDAYYGEAFELNIKRQIEFLKKNL